MSEPSKKLDIDLGFLDKKDSVKPKPPKEEGGSDKDPKKSVPDPISNPDVKTTGYKYNWKNIMIIGGIVLFFVWAIFSGSNSSNNSISNSSESPVAPVVSGQAIIPSTTTPVVDKVDHIVPKLKTDNQICVSDYGSHSYATGEKNATGEPVCDCESGYTWDSTKTSCVITPPLPKSGYEICQDRNGSHATYDSANNSCGCEEGYSLSATTNQCVDALTARDDNCSASYPGTSFLKYDATTNKNICDCKAGYEWDNEKTACYTSASFNQSCISSYGTGAYSTTENGKRVCDCSHGYSFNIERTMCVTTASITALCVKEVGRNSRYDGTVTNGKYNCTEPY